MCTKLPPESDSERIAQHGLDLPKLSSKVKCIVFLFHSLVKKIMLCPFYWPVEYWRHILGHIVVINTFSFWWTSLYSFDIAIVHGLKQTEIKMKFSKISPIRDCWSTLRNWRFCQVQGHMTQKLGQVSKIRPELEPGLPVIFHAYHTDKIWANFRLLHHSL